MNWQPIETAPKDGSTFLVAMGGLYAFARYHYPNRGLPKKGFALNPEWYGGWTKKPFLQKKLFGNGLDKWDHVSPHPGWDFDRWAPLPKYIHCQ